MKQPPRPAFTRLGDVKGGDILAELKAKLKPSPPAPAAPAVPPPSAVAKTSASTKARQRKDKAQKKVQPKANKTVLKMPRSAIDAAYRAAEGQRSPSPAPLSLPSPQTLDFGEAAFHRLRKLQVSLTGFTADHRAPTGVGDLSRAIVTERIALAARLFENIVDPLADGYIGYDFGTSTTKAVVRWPLDSSRDDYAIPVPADCASSGIPHLWPTVVYFDRVSGAFSLSQHTGTLQLQGFKGALIEQQGHRICLGSGATMSAAATAFLTLHLAYVIGTISQLDATARISGINLAVPVASLNDRANCPHFDNVVRAAILLIPKAASLTLGDVEAALADSDLGLLPHDLHPELSGAIAGYCRGPRHFVGSHMIIDCGSATLDIASFNLGNDDYPIGIHSAGVELLGADACQTYVNAGGSGEDCRDAARFHEHQVYARAVRTTSAGFGQDDNRKYPYQVILIGGGINNPFYGTMLQHFERAFARPFHRPQLDHRLQCDARTHHGRLILADGLARDPIDLRKVLMPAPPKDRPPPLNPNYHDWTSN